MALLIGNDINYTESVEWKHLLKKLIKNLHLVSYVNVLDDKPLTLLFEEILAKIYILGEKPEKEVLKLFADLLKDIEPNEIHKRIVSSNQSDIITTNFDLTFEKLLTENSEELTNDGFINESRYSVFRKYSFDSTNIWHAQGDLNYINSMVLGFEHYSGYLQAMRGYISTGSTYEKRSFKTIKERLDEIQEIKYSWLDFFFTEDIHIIGLSLAFTEIHFWWLLNIRYKYKSLKIFPISNHIVYYYPEELKKISESKLQILDALGVITNPIEGKFKNNKASYYSKVLDLANI